MCEAAAHDSAKERLAACARSGERIGFALGTFPLIHAGTVVYLRRAREGCDRLFAIVLPGEGEQDTGEGTLLRPSERVRVLEMLVEVDGAIRIDLPDAPTLEEVHTAAPAAVWMRCTAENDVDDTTLRRLAQVGIEVNAVDAGQECTTRAILERVAR